MVSAIFWLGSRPLANRLGTDPYARWYEGTGATPPSYSRWLLRACPTNIGDSDE